MLGSYAMCAEVLGSSRKFSEVCGVVGSGANLQNMHNLTTALPPSWKCAEVLGSSRKFSEVTPLDLPTTPWIGPGSYQQATFPSFHPIFSISSNLFPFSVDITSFQTISSCCAALCTRAFPKPRQRPIISSVLGKIWTMGRHTCPVSQASNPSGPIST